LPGLYNVCRALTCISFYKNVFVRAADIGPLWRILTEVVYIYWHSENCLLSSSFFPLHDNVFVSLLGAGDTTGPPSSFNLPQL